MYCRIFKIDKVLVVVFLFLLVACEKNTNTSTGNFRTIHPLPIKGYELSQDSFAIPKGVLLDESKLKQTLLPNLNLVPTNLNVHAVGNPKIVPVTFQKLNTPGKDTFKLPLIVKAVCNQVLAAVSEAITAKDAYTKDQNPQNFSSFSKLQGLTHTNITFLCEDSFGNLWLATGGGGVTKYDGNTFTHFTEKEGLANNFVTCISQDKNGNIWFGTENGGLSKYDGKYFTNFSEKEGLGSNYVTCILHDASNNIWVGTKEDGIVKFDGRTFVHFTNKQGLSGNTVTGMIQDKSGKLWIATKENGISVFDGKSFKNFTEEEGLPTNYISTLLQDKNGNIWLGTNDQGVLKFDGKSITCFTEKEGLSSNAITSILQDKSGAIWFGTNGAGALKFDGKSFTYFSEAEGLNNTIIRHVFEDRNGVLWFAKGGGGVSKYNPKSFNYFTEQEGLSNSTVLSIVQDHEGKIWMGTEGGGVSIYHNNSFVHFTKKDGLSDNIVYSIVQDKQRNIWLGTASGLTKFDGKTVTKFIDIEGLSNNTIYSILQDSRGTLWFASDGGGVFRLDGKNLERFTTQQGLSSNVVRTIFEDHDRNIWLGTYGGGLTKFQFSAGNSKNVKTITHFTKKQGLPDDYIRSIIQDKEGNFWLGSLGFKGLTFFDEKNILSLTEKEGLSNNVVCSVLQDYSGNIWCGNRFGLSKLSSEKWKGIVEKVKNKKAIASENLFESFTYDDGFLGVGCNSNSIFISEKETIWVGANDRLTVFNTSTFNQLKDTFPPGIQLKSLELFNENIPWMSLNKKKDSVLVLGNGVAISDYQFSEVSNWYGIPKELSLAYNNNYLTFNFIGITTFRPKKVKYQYQLEGLDQNWSALTQKTSATYGNLPHGNYIFKVKALNSDGLSSETFEYAFTIRPPWWKTWWFRILMVSISFFSVVLYVKRRERKLRVEKIILEKTVKSRTAELVEKNVLVQEQKKIVEEKHKEITDSINYAERIQRSFLASKELLDEHLNDYFIFFQPKDIVSGDFYWASETIDGHFIYACADSTGHGVPGAIMSLLNITSIEKAIESNSSPAAILNTTRKIIIERLKKDGSPEGGKDGMDASLIVLNKEKTKLVYAAANNPIWIIRRNEMGQPELLEAKPDKMPIGKHDKDQMAFNQYEIELQKGDLIYSFTDGFPDQFGGPKGKKYKYTQLKEFLLSISGLELEEQLLRLKSEFHNWKGDLEQVDDVCVMGVRI